MKTTRSRCKKRDQRRAGPEFKVVRIECRPTHDAQQRMQRLYALFVECATKGRTVSSIVDSSPADEVLIDGPRRLHPESC